MYEDWGDFCTGSLLESRAEISVIFGYRSFWLEFWKKRCPHKVILNLTPWSNWPLTKSYLPYFSLKLFRSSSFSLRCVDFLASTESFFAHDDFTRFLLFWVFAAKLKFELVLEKRQITLKNFAIEHYLNC